ncbi:MAG TPA: hypothetical protein VFM29_04670 [Vicinamibacteria bacterium]|nr:hypothetical protein [Vicinamibacteria bacterium]
MRRCSRQLSAILRLLVAEMKRVEQARSRVSVALVALEGRRSRTRTASILAFKSR